MTDGQVVRLVDRLSWMGTPTGVRVALGFALLATVLAIVGVAAFGDWSSLLWLVTGWVLYWTALRIRRGRAAFLLDRPAPSP